MQQEFLVPRDGDRLIRLRLEHTLYPHWGGRSGYPCFSDYLDRARFRVDKHGVPDSDEGAQWLGPMRPWVLSALRLRRMKWYKLGDLNAEFDAGRECLRGNVDVLHFLDGEHSGQFLPGLLRLARSRVRTVATFHQPPNLLDNLLDRRVLRHFNHIVLMSPSQRSFFDELMPPEKVSVIQHGVDTEFFRPGHFEERPKTIRCITVGHWLRDWSVFRAVAERMPEIEFHAVTARDTQADHLPNVFLHRGIDDEALASLYRDSHILFLPLEDSTANNALLEGIASGLPVITTDLVSTRSYLSGDEAILTPRGDFDAAVVALGHVRADIMLRFKMGKSARAQAERLSWRRIAVQYENLFENLCS